MKGVCDYGYQRVTGRKTECGGPSSTQEVKAGKSGV